MIPAGSRGDGRRAGAVPHRTADALVVPLRAAGHPVARVPAEDFWRPASLRFERGRTDPDAYYEERLDAGGLRRTVLDPLAPGGSGMIVTSLWDDRPALIEP